MSTKIAYITNYYSHGMGYIENCLPRYLKDLGYEVRIFTSNLQVYGLERNYIENYQKFLGPPKVNIGIYMHDGLIIKRLKPITYFNKYIIYLKGLKEDLLEYNPNIIHINSPISPILFNLMNIRSWLIFTECHQHKSIAAPIEKWKKNPNNFHRYVWYRLTRTLIGKILSIRLAKCFAISPDCAAVANYYYGIPKHKIVKITLGTDTDIFYPLRNAEDQKKRNEIRANLNISNDSMVVIYTGKLSQEKNPLLLAEAVENLADRGYKIKAIIVGDGEQSRLIRRLKHSLVLPYRRHVELAELYRAADLAVWPNQESLSMLDAMASGLPVIISDNVGDPDRIIDDSLTYKANDINSLQEKILLCMNYEKRKIFSMKARERASQNYSWRKVAEQVSAVYQNETRRKLSEMAYV